MKNGITFSVKEREFSRALKQLVKDKNAIDRKFINSALTRNARPILNDMKSNSKSDRIARMTAITTRQSKRPKAPKIGVRVGVINNDTSLFPTFTAPALASVIEYGTAERFRKLKAGIFVTGRQSTGEMPSAPFIRPAWDNNINSLISKTEQSILRKLDK